LAKQTLYWARERKTRKERTVETIEIIFAEYCKKVPHISQSLLRLQTKSAAASDGGDNFQER
jgi:hypothetical protein